MKTNTSDKELFMLSQISPRLSNQTLEDIASTVARQPEFPSRLSPPAQDAFKIACYHLLLRHGQGEYDGFTEDASMQRIGGFYVSQFCTDALMRSQIEGLFRVEDLGVAELEQETSPAPVELPLAPVNHPEYVATVTRPRVNEDESYEDALAKARAEVAAAYNDLP